MLYERGEVILTGEALGIYKTTGEKYYVDWELNTTSGEENVAPCILKIYDEKEDKTWEVRDLSFNILFVIIAAALVAGVVWGWKRGLIEGIVRMISSILGVAVLLAVAQGIYRYTKGGIGSIIITLLLLGIIGVIQKIVKFITNTFRLVKAVPVGKLADKLAGAIFGVAEVLCIIWVAFILIGSFDLFGLKQWLLEQVAQSRFLQMIYNTNYLILLLQWIFAQFQ